SKEIARNAIKSRHIAPDAVRGSDVKEATLGLVPHASLADHATSADTAGSADHAANADLALTSDHALTADRATTADQVGSLAPAALGSGLVTGVIADTGNNAQVFATPSGSSTSDTAVQLVQTSAPDAPTQARSLFVQVTNLFPSVGDTWTVELQANGGKVLG